MRMPPRRPIKRLWFSLALSVLTQPTTGVVAPTWGSSQTGHNHLGTLKSNLQIGNSGGSLLLPKPGQTWLHFVK